MITVFKPYLNWLVAAECVILAIIAAMRYDGLSLSLMILVFLGLSLIAYWVLEFMSGLAHQRLLGVLYIWQQPREFIKVYEPLCFQKNVRKNMRFSMIAYLSNAYCAAGDFKKALALLEDMPKLPKARIPEAQALLAGNRCSIYLYMGSAEKARAELELLESTTPLLPAKKRLQHISSAQLLEQRLSLLEETATEETADLIRGRLHGKQSPYYKTELSYALAQVYRFLGHEDFALDYFTEAAKAADTWVGRQAKKQMK